MDTQIWINGAITLGLAASGWYARQLWDAVARLRTDLHAIEVDLPKSYVAKSDFIETMARIEKMFERIDAKLDAKMDR